MQTIRPLILKNAREKKGWSQKQLGQTTGVSGATISRMESGKIEISDEYLINAANALDDPAILLDKCSHCETANALRNIAAMLYPDISPDKPAAMLKRWTKLLEAVTAEFIELSNTAPPEDSFERVHRTLQLKQLLERLEVIVVGINAIYR